MNLKKFLKPGKNMVLELDDDVEYLVDDRVVEALEREDKYIYLIRLMDNQAFKVEIARVKKAISIGGIIDYLDKKESR